MIRITTILTTLVMLASTAAAKKSTYYTPNVKSMNQNVIKSPRNGKKDVYEGCGPVAAAMLLGFWQTERNARNLLASGFDGSRHPAQAIKKLYREMKTKKAPGKKNKASYTMPDSLYRTLKARVKKHAKIKANRMRRSVKWSKREAALKAQLRKGNPVILLKHREHKDGCLGKSSKGWNLIKNLANSHYFLAVGYKGGKVAVMPGWSSQPKQNSSGFSEHKANDAGHGLCTFSELKKAKVSMFWLERK